jgi:outer membrane murein-binding lipoprotein Lpp
MTGRYGAALLALGAAVALGGCGQLFAQGSSSVTVGELASRVNSLGAQVGQLQATVAGGGATAAGSVPPGLASAVVEADVLNVREDPSLQGTIRGTLLQNAVVGILKEDGNWTEITYHNPRTGVTLTGWVDSDYLGPATPGPAGSGTAAAGSATAPAAASAMSGTASGAAATPASGISASGATAAGSTSMASGY